MPIDLLTTFGKTDYAVTENFKRVAVEFGALEAKVASITAGSGVAELRAEMRRLSAQVQTLARQVQALQQAP